MALIIVLDQFKTKLFNLILRIEIWLETTEAKRTGGLFNGSALPVGRTHFPNRGMNVAPGFGVCVIPTSRPI